MLVGFTGLRGSGKTLLVTEMALKAIKEGRSVFSNYSIVGARKWRNLAEILNIRHNPEREIYEPIIVVDEINLIMPSRQWKSFPMELAMYWAQSRKFGVDLWWTSQSLRRVDTIIREITELVWNCRRVSFFFFSFHKAEAYLPDQIDAMGAYAGSAEMPAYLKPLEKKYYWPKKNVIAQYNTLEPIALPDNIVKSFSQNALNCVLRPEELPMCVELPKRYENTSQVAKHKRRIGLMEKAGLGLGKGEQGTP